MKLSKRISLGMLNIILSCLTLWYAIGVLLSKTPEERLRSILYFSAPIVLSLLGGILTFLGKRWWWLVGIIAVVSFWIIVLFALSQMGR
jgi:hypothetical protein